MPTYPHPWYAYEYGSVHTPLPFTINKHGDKRLGTSGTASLRYDAKTLGALRRMVCHASHWRSQLISKAVRIVVAHFGQRHAKDRNQMGTTPHTPNTRAAVQPAIVHEAVRPGRPATADCGHKARAQQRGCARGIGRRNQLPRCFFPLTEVA